MLKIPAKKHLKIINNTTESIQYNYLTRFYAINKSRLQAVDENCSYSTTSILLLDKC